MLLCKHILIWQNQTPSRQAWKTKGGIETACSPCGIGETLYLFKYVFLESQSYGGSGPAQGWFIILPAGRN